jgi:prepilin-type N-terminal cleavage/methylation domain-containing protein
MKRRLADESGLTLIELMVVMVILAIVLGALANVFISGMRANSDANARLAAQGSLRQAMDRLEYEVRCSSGATVSGGGSTVLLTLPSQCIHATGTYTWCVSSGALLRYSGSTCSGTGQTFASNVTTPTPFSLLTGTGLLPRLQVTLSVNTSGRPSDRASVSDTITLRNGTHG